MERSETETDRPMERSETEIKANTERVGVKIYQFPLQKLLNGKWQQN